MKPRILLALLVAALAGHRPLPAQRVFNKDEPARRRAGADGGAQGVDLLAPPVLRAVEEEVFGRDVFRQLIVPLNDQPGDRVSRGRQRR